MLFAVKLFFAYPRLGVTLCPRMTLGCDQRVERRAFSLPGLNGLDLQKQVAVERPDMPIIFITGHGDVPKTVQAMKGGSGRVPYEAI